MLYKYFKQGTNVIGNSLNGQKIIGIYRGMRNSFGCYVYGVPEYSSEKAQMHTCYRMTLTPNLLNLKIDDSMPNPILFVGEKCRGVTPKNQIIVGFYAGPLSKLAYLRGWPADRSHNELKETFKVVRKSIKRGWDQ